MATTGRALPHDRDLGAPADGGRKRRRPSGEPPPLPRQLHTSGRYWLALGAFVIVGWILQVVAEAWREVERIDLAVLRGLAELRLEAPTEVARAIHALGSDWTIRILRWSTLFVLLFYKRFRHLCVFMGSILLVGWVTTTAALLVSRPRPVGVEIIGYWDGFSHPSRPVATLAVTLIGMTYALVPAGRARTRAKWVAGALVLFLGLARLYLAVDHPTDIIVAVIVGVTIPLIAFRSLTPNEVFPVTYKRGRGAHLDVSGRRGEAIRRALEDQLGLPVGEIKPFGLGGSAGSTPLLLHLDDQAGTRLFAKIYAANHLRADRWYKLGRTLLYGRLEDEGSFSTVRRLVQYEDYMLRVMLSAGLPTPETYGFVEITPEREYMLVVEFFSGTKELREADVDEEIIDSALQIVRTMWDAGLAHRDIKPSNVLVGNGRVFLIDVAFAEARPSPWRQAVDLGNMMLCLALRSNASLVYERALQYFSPHEVAEAFAATKGVTMPSQLRNLLKKDGRDLLTQFRGLAPEHPPISIQRWSLRRVALMVGVLCSGLITLLIATANLRGAGLL